MRPRTKEEEARIAERPKKTETEQVVLAYWDLVDRREDGDETRDCTISWRAVRFVGTYDGRTVTNPIEHGDPAWVRELQRLMHDDRLPRTVSPCRPAPSESSVSKGPWHNSTWIFPEQVDWSGYRHAGGDPERRARSGRSGPTIEERLRKREQVKLSLSEDRATALRAAAERRGLSVSEYVATRVAEDE